MRWTWRFAFSRLIRNGCPYTTDRGPVGWVSHAPPQQQQCQPPSRLRLLQCWAGAMSRTVGEGPQLSSADHSPGSAGSGERPRAHSSRSTRSLMVQQSAHAAPCGRRRTRQRSRAPLGAAVVADGDGDAVDGVDDLRAVRLHAATA